MADRFNDEGYYDPTPYKVLQQMEAAERAARFRPLVYICSPYRGDEAENARKAQYYCRFAVEGGALPIAPHIYFTQFMFDENEDEREKAMFMNHILLTKCHELWVFGNKVSAGMEKEIGWAKRRNMTIRKFSEDLEEIL